MKKSELRDPKLQKQRSGRGGHLSLAGCCCGRPNQRNMVQGVRQACREFRDDKVCSIRDLIA